MAGGGLIAICAAMVPGPVTGETARGLVAIAAVVFIVSRKSHLYYRPELARQQLARTRQERWTVPAR
jgi:hypothetical protein